MTPNAEIRAEYSLQPFQHSQVRTSIRRSCDSKIRCILITSKGQLPVSSPRVWLRGARIQLKIYDALYRLTRAVTTGSTNYPAWGLSEPNDRYGNRLAQSVYSDGVSPITLPD